VALLRYPAPPPEGVAGRPIWRGNFNKIVNWLATVTAIGVPGLHFHDLRHFGNVQAAGTGASLRDLMDRMGQDSERAALIYQHRSVGADHAIANAVNAAVEREQRKAVKRRPRKGKKRSGDPDDGTAGCLARVS
jgi:integrase